MPSPSIIHVSGGICAPQRAASPASTVEQRAGLWVPLRARPVPLFTNQPTLLPTCRGWWRAGEGDSTPLYRQNLLSTIWPLGRQVPAGRRPARNLQAGRSRCRREEERVAGGRRRMQVQKRIAAGGWNPGRRAQLVHRNDCFSPLPSLTASQHRLYDFEKSRT